MVTEPGPGQHPGDPNSWCFCLLYQFPSPPSCWHRGCVGRRVWVESWQQCQLSAPVPQPGPPGQNCDVSLGHCPLDTLLQVVPFRGLGSPCDCNCEGGMLLVALGGQKLVPHRMWRVRILDLSRTHGQKRGSLCPGCEGLGDPHPTPSAAPSHLKAVPGGDSQVPGRRQQVTKQGLSLSASPGCQRDFGHLPLPHVPLLWGG